MNKKIQIPLKIIVVYIICWHVSFFLMFLTRGDSLSFSLYANYFKYLYSVGAVIPTFIQFFAVIFMLIYFLVSFLARKRDKSD